MARISGSLLPRLFWAGGEGLGMRGHSAEKQSGFSCKLGCRKPLTPGPSPRSGARGASVDRVRSTSFPRSAWERKNVRSADTRVRSHAERRNEDGRDTTHSHLHRAAGEVGHGSGDRAAYKSVFHQGLAISAEANRASSLQLLSSDGW